MCVICSEYGITHHPPHVDINARERRQGSTPLHLAVAAHNLPLARALLKHGADPACHNRDGQTPLALARRLWLARHCHEPEASATAMVELLLAHAAGDELLLSSDVTAGVKKEAGGGNEVQIEHENPLRFVKGAGAR